MYVLHHGHEKMTNPVAFELHIFGVGEVHAPFVVWEG